MNKKFIRVLQERYPNESWNTINGELDNIWTYHIWSPLSFDDDAVVKVVVEFGQTKCEQKKKFTLQIS